MSQILEEQRDFVRFISPLYVCLLQVALVVFDNKVQYYGDGGAESSQLNSGSLDDYNVLMKQGQVFGSDLSLREIQDSLG